MTREVPDCARELAGRLSSLFDADSRLAGRLCDAQARLLGANDRLLYPDALGFVCDGARRIAGRDESPLEREHWAIRQAFVDYQSACEERRQLAFDVGEVAAQLTEVLRAAGWSVKAARTVDVHTLAMGAR